MAGIFVELIVSWLLLWFIQKKHLSALGLLPTGRRLLHLLLGLLIAATCCAVYEWMTTAFAGNQWVAKANTKSTFVAAARYTIISVLYEELIFRGALLYIAIKKIGFTKACFLSAICFGIYHWFSFNVIGNPVMMIVVFFMTSIVGLSWAHAFAKTGSMYLPIGLHFAWNFMLMFVFSNDGHGDGVLVRANDHRLDGLPSLIVFAFQVLAMPALTFLYLRYLDKSSVLLRDTSAS
jgi:uncharacterized protein